MPMSQADSCPALASCRGHPLALPPGSRETGNAGRRYPEPVGGVKGDAGSLIEPVHGAVAFCRAPPFGFCFAGVPLRLAQ
jgi:hypothetical protein